MSELEKRIRYIEDLEAIRRLKHFNYCHCVDRTVAGDSAAIKETLGRFSEDIVADFTGFPLAEGLEAVTEFYVSTVPSILSYSQHYVFNEVIDIKGDHATGLWYVNCPVVFTESSPLGSVGPGVVAGRYEEEYVLEDGVWKWRRIVALLDIVKPADAFWEGAELIRENR